MTRSYRAFVAAFAFAVVGGCSDSDTQAPTPPQHYAGASVQDIPENVLAAAVHVRAESYDSAYIEYHNGTGAVVRTPAVDFEGDSVARVPVLGLDTATAYTFRVVLTRAGTADQTVDSLPFTSGSLPTWIPAIGSTGNAAQPGYLALSLPQGGIIVDNTGKVVWYRYIGAGSLSSFQAQPTGAYSLIGNGAAKTEFLLLNSLGEASGVLSCAGRPTRFHELLVSADGEAWLLCDETRTMNLTAVGGVAAATVTGTVVQRQSADGTLLWEWSTFDHFEITDLPLADRTGPLVNFTHGNGLGFDSDSNLILGFRSLNEVTKVDRSTGTIIWRFGGLRNQFTVLNDPKGVFEHQHGVRWAGSGRVQLLDNGLSAPSRLVRYLLDTAAMTATLEWEFIDAPTTFTAVGGSTQYHLDGHAMVAFGQGGRVIEVDEAGQRTWELTGLDGFYIFRAQRIGSLYAAGRGEPTR